MSAPKTRHQAATRLVEFVGPEKDLNAGEVLHCGKEFWSERGYQGGQERY